MCSNALCWSIFPVYILRRSYREWCYLLTPTLQYPQCTRPRCPKMHAKLLISHTQGYIFFAPTIVFRFLKNPIYFLWKIQPHNSFCYWKLLVAPQQPWFGTKTPQTNWEGLIPDQMKLHVSTKDVIVMLYCKLLKI